MSHLFQALAPKPESDSEEGESSENGNSENSKSGDELPHKEAKAEVKNEEFQQDGGLCLTPVKKSDQDEENEPEDGEFEDGDSPRKQTVPPEDLVCSGCDATPFMLTFIEETQGLTYREWGLPNWYGVLCMLCKRMAKSRYPFLATKTQISSHLSVPSQKNLFKRHSGAYLTLRMEGRVQMNPALIDNRERALSSFMPYFMQSDASSMLSQEAILMTDLPALRPQWNPVVAEAQFISLRTREEEFRLLCLSPLSDELGTRPGIVREYPANVNIYKNSPCSSVEDMTLLGNFAKEAQRFAKDSNATFQSSEVPIKRSLLASPSPYPSPSPPRELKGKGKTTAKAKAKNKKQDEADEPQDEIQSLTWPKHPESTKIKRNMQKHLSFVLNLANPSFESTFKDTQLKTCLRYATEQRQQVGNCKFQELVERADSNVAKFTRLLEVAKNWVELQKEESLDTIVQFSNSLRPLAEMLRDRNLILHPTLFFIHVHGSFLDTTKTKSIGPALEGLRKTYDYNKAHYAKLVLEVPDTEHKEYSAWLEKVVVEDYVVDYIAHREVTAAAIEEAVAFFNEYASFCQHPFTDGCQIRGRSLSELVPLMQDGYNMQPKLVASAMKALNQYSANQVVTALGVYEFGKQLLHKVELTTKAGDKDTLADSCRDQCIKACAKIAGKHLLAFASMGDMGELLSYVQYIITKVTAMMDQWSTHTLSTNLETLFTLVRLASQVCKQADYVVANFMTDAMHPFIQQTENPPPDGQGVKYVLVSLKNTMEESVASRLNVEGKLCESLKALSTFVKSDFFTQKMRIIGKDAGTLQAELEQMRTPIEERQKLWTHSPIMLNALVDLETDYEGADSYPTVFEVWRAQQEKQSIGAAPADKVPFLTVVLQAMNSFSALCALDTQTLGDFGQRKLSDDASARMANVFLFALEGSVPRSIFDARCRKTMFSAISLAQQTIKSSAMVGVDVTVLQACEDEGKLFELLVQGQAKGFDTEVRKYCDFSDPLMPNFARLPHVLQVRVASTLVNKGMVQDSFIPELQKEGGAPLSKEAVTKLLTIAGNSGTLQFLMGSAHHQVCCDDAHTTPKGEVAPLKIGVLKALQMALKTGLKQFDDEKLQDLDMGNHMLIQTIGFHSTWCRASSEFCARLVCFFLCQLVKNARAAANALQSVLPPWSNFIDDVKFEAALAVNEILQSPSRSQVWAKSQFLDKMLASIAFAGEVCALGVPVEQHVALKDDLGYAISVKHSAAKAVLVTNALSVICESGKKVTGPTAAASILETAKETANMQDENFTFELPKSLLKILNALRDGDRSLLPDLPEIINTSKKRKKAGKGQGSVSDAATGSAKQAKIEDGPNHAVKHEDSKDAADVDAKTLDVGKESVGHDSESCAVSLLCDDL